MTKKNTSDEMNKEEKTAGNQTEEMSAEETANVTEEAPIEKNELELMTEKYNEINDRYLRLYSEFDNFRKRTSKEKLELYKTAGEDIFISLLPVMDDFERAMKSINESQDIQSIKDGIELIHQKFEKGLAQKGLKAIESSVGKDFDLNLHEAITSIPAPDKKLKGKVIDEVEKGYLLNDKVIRYTKVVIGQ
jgi:molecular chaperone GrpE